MGNRRLTQGIDVDRLDRLVKDLGVRIKLFKSTIVPDVKSLESMDQDLNNTVGDNNFLDFDCFETIALFQQQNLMKQFDIQGTFHIDEVLVTFLSGQTLAPGAKIELLDFEEDFYELVQRQTGQDFDVLKYSACNILAVFTVANNVITRYHKGADFTIDPNGNIQWIGTHRPADTVVYSIYYKYHPVYRALKAVHRDRFSQFNTRTSGIKAPKQQPGDGNTYVKMPETWVIKRDYLIRRRDLSGAVIENTYFDPNA